jgi:hypothetical protein
MTRLLLAPQRRLNSPPVSNHVATARQQITNMQAVSKAQLNAHKAQLTAAGISVPALVAAQLVDPP